MKKSTRLFLTFLAGYCDTVTFVHMEGIFSAHVTGNFVLFAAAMAHGVRSEDYIKLVTFPVFVFGVSIATLLFINAEKAKAKGRKTSGLSRILGVMSLLLLATSGLATISSEPVDIAITLIVVFTMAMQNTLHHFISGTMTTVMTGTVMNTVARWTKKAIKADAEPAVAARINTVWLILFFATGCFLAAYATSAFRFYVLWLPAVILPALWLIERKAPKEDHAHV